VVTLRTIFDQPEAIAFLSRALGADRLPHGMIFAGPVGVGKATTARALASIFLCQAPTLDTDPPAPCGRCESCRGMTSGNHPDFHLVYRQLIRLEKDESKAIDLPIAVIRQYLVEPANRKAVLNNGKVFVVEEAELMNAAAQNALLKTLEEPYGKTLLIFLTDQPNLLLQTIRSRCQIVRFSALSRERVMGELKTRGVDPSSAQDAADFAEGSLGLALKWVEDGVLPHARRLEMLLKRIFSTAQPDASELQDLIKTAADEYAEKQLARDKLASKPQATREGLLIYLKLSAQVLRRQLRDTDDPDSLERLCSAIDAIARAETYLDSNVNVPLVLQQLSIALEGHAVV
jgi:DNA polymerase III subunit delta'